MISWKAKPLRLSRSTATSSAGNCPNRLKPVPMPLTGNLMVVTRPEENVQSLPWIRIGISVPQTRPEAESPTQQIKHLAGGGTSLKPLYGTELIHFVPYGWLIPASKRRTSARGFPFRRPLIISAAIGSKRRAGRCKPWLRCSLGTPHAASGLLQRLRPSGSRSVKKAAPTASPPSSAAEAVAKP